MVVRTREMSSCVMVEEEEVGAGEGENQAPGDALSRLLAVARHGGLATLPPAQRHLLARVSLAGFPPATASSHLILALQRRQALLLRHRRRLLQRRLPAHEPPASPVLVSGGFRRPTPRSSPRQRDTVPGTTPTQGRNLTVKSEEEEEQWIPVPWSGPQGGRVRCEDHECGSEVQWRPVKVEQLFCPSLLRQGTALAASVTAAPTAPPSPSSSLDGHPPHGRRCKRRPPRHGWRHPPARRTTRSPSRPVASEVTGRLTLVPITDLVDPGTSPVTQSGCGPGGVASAADGLWHTPATCHLWGPAVKYSWENQLTRIFLQEGTDDDHNKEAEAAEGEAADTSTSSSVSKHPLPYSDGSSACSSSIDSSSNNNKVSSPSAPHSTSVVTTLAGTGMGNPFARATPQATWGSESSDHRPILAPPRLSPHSDSAVATKVSSSGSSVLRPSALSSGRVGGHMRGASSLFTPPTLTVTGSSPPQSSKSEFKLKPSVLGSANPFSRTQSEHGDKADSASGSEDGVPGTSDESASCQVLGQDVSSSTSVVASQPSRVTPSSVREDRLHANSSETSNTSSNSTSNSSSRGLFVSLARNGDGKDSSSSPNLGSNNFIFGQNLQSKVAGAESSVTSSSDAAGTTNGEKQTGNLFSDAASEIARSPDSASSIATTNGRPITGNLFSDAASEISLPSDENSWTSGQSLEESSRELTEKEKSQKRKFDQVEVITGEENESNVLQMNCKLYAWVSGTWQERGRGILRLNDWDAGQEIHSRLVIRTQGTLTVMLNTKVWAEMSVERASSKSVRFTALDADGQPKIFLAMGSPKDVDLLYNSLEWRVATSRSQAHDDGDGDGAKKPKVDEKEAAAVTS
ncbi:uncharacterized protein [Panulirus ornatus]|uniref:uncharacterized protein isoform X1 n=1 Tax=Panulirus ornatus TaxID=150431 RepID=UPI003A8BA5CD